MNKKKVVSYIIGCILLIIISIFIRKEFIYKSQNSNLNSLINISELSDKFINNYFNEIKELNKSRNTNNILIVISPKKIENSYGASKIITAPNNQYIFQYKNEKYKKKALEAFKNDKTILSVEENKKYTLTEINQNNDSSYNSWGIEKMGLDKALDSIDTNRLEEVTVAVLDSGCDVDLLNKYYKGKIKDTYNVYDDNDTMYDNNGHGTHVAGTIAEGTSDNVKIVPVKHTDYMSIDVINIIAGINWITYNEKADVINMSFGGESSTSLYQSIESAKKKNIICVAASGNDNTSIPSFPAAYDNTISIASVDNNLNKSDFSNYGKNITFTTPGTNIKSLMGNYTELSKNNGNNDDDDDHEVISGTSMATPHAVCAVALLKSYNKNLTLDNTIELLKKHTIDLGNDGFDQIYGYGFIDFSSAKFCDGNNCDSYNVFKKENNKMITKVDIGTDTYESLYNYGNNTNLLNMQIKIYYSENKYVTKDLGELENLEIENYNPYLEGEQIVTIKYNDFTLTKKVVNYLNDGWNYREYNGNGSIEIIGINDENNYPKYIELPKIYKGQRIDSISYTTFYRKADLKQVKILSDISTIDSSTFSGCINLESIILPETISIIGDFAFHDTQKLYSIELPKNIQEINNGAFFYSGISSITIPGSVKKIEEQTFMSTHNLLTVNIENGVQEIASKAFYDSNNLSTIHIPKTVTKIEDNAFGKDISMKNINIDEENEFYESEPNSATIVEKKTNVLVAASEESVIPEKVKIVGPYSISSSSLYKIPEGITELKDYALLNCAAGVSLPNSLTKIESSNTFLQDEYYIIFVYNQSYAYNFLNQNNIKYNIIGTEKIEVTTENKIYKAFETVNEDSTSISITYEGTGNAYEFISNTFLQRYKIKYKNNNDSFRYGDTYFIISFDSLLLGKHYDQKVNVKVEKAIPEYTLPSNLKAKIGTKLSKIDLPSGFHWENPDEIAVGTGIKKYLAKYIPIDKDNYETIENIELEVLVKSDKKIISPNISINNKIFDNTNYINPIDLTISNLNSNEYIITQLYTEEVNVGKTKAIVHLKLSDEKFLNYTFDDGTQEKEFEIDIEILPKKFKKPTLKDTNYIYNGKEQKAILDNFIEDKMNISGNIRTEAGSQNIIISLADKNYIWEDDTNQDISLVFTIEKANPQISYNVSKTVFKYDGQLHNINVTINSPKNVKVKYMNSEGEYILDSCPSYQGIGDYLIKYKLYLEDNNNYNEIYGEKKLVIRDKIIDYTSKDYEGIYDGIKHTIDLKVNDNNYSVRYSINDLSYNLSSLPEFSDVGEYIVNYKISSPDFGDIEESNKVIIYGIKELDSQLSITENNIITNTDSFKDLVSKISIFAKSNTITHLDSNGEFTESDIIKKGDSLLIKINNASDLKYNILINEKENDINNTYSKENNKNNSMNVIAGDTSKNNNKIYYIIGLIMVICGIQIILKQVKEMNM